MATAKKVGDLGFRCLQTHMAFRPALEGILKALVSLERQLCGDIDRTIRMHKNMDTWRHGGRADGWCVAPLHAASVHPSVAVYILYPDVPVAPDGCVT
mmetsp:Transcript_5198/g.12218  ORF Transcript_5198/g.12218 Transcript_5198/m.12218 type:complete len:98 (-) Transcript_5198:280-573(-)